MKRPAGDADEAAEAVGEKSEVNVGERSSAAAVEDEGRVRQGLCDRGAARDSALEQLSHLNITKAFVSAFGLDDSAADSTR